jgi:hypothetical protein
MPDGTVLCGEKGKPSAVTVGKYHAWLNEPDSGWTHKPSSGVSGNVTLNPLRS